MLLGLRNGGLAGLLAGVVFGMMMAMMGALPMIAGMVGSSSPVVGFGIHLVISAIIGAGYGLAFERLAGRTAAAIVAGAGYGMVWWVLGPLTLMPLFLGMGWDSQWNAAGVAGALPSLMGHTIYGLSLGFAFTRLHRRVRSGLRVRTA